MFLRHDTVDGSEIRRKPTWDEKNLVNKGIIYRSTTSSQDLLHQQYGYVTLDFQSSMELSSLIAPNLPSFPQWQWAVGDNYSGTSIFLGTETYSLYMSLCQTSLGRWGKLRKLYTPNKKPNMSPKKGWNIQKKNQTLPTIIL